MLGRVVDRLGGAVASQEGREPDRPEPVDGGKDRPGIPLGVGSLRCRGTDDRLLDAG